MDAFECKCGRCGEIVVPRGGRPPRFCPRCGMRLVAPPAAAAGGYAGRTGGVVPQTPGAAVAAFVLGLVGIVMPLCGFPCSVLACALGVRANRRIRESGGALNGGGLAVAGVVLGVVGMLFWGVVCAASA